MERYPLNKGLQLFVSAVIFRIFSSFHMTLSSKQSFIKVVDLWVIFLYQFESPHLDVCRRSYGQNTKTAQSWKVATLHCHDSWMQWWVVTEGYGDDSWQGWRLVTNPSLLLLTPKPSFFILASPKLVPSTYQS